MNLYFKVYSSKTNEEIKLCTRANYFCIKGDILYLQREKIKNSGEKVIYTLFAGDTSEFYAVAYK